MWPAMGLVFYMQAKKLSKCDSDEKTSVDDFKIHYKSPPARLLGYAHIVGEAFRSQTTNYLIPSRVVSMVYILADMYDGVSR